MQRNHPLVSINLLTYNARPYIKDCLNSVLKQTYPYIEILVIDNDSFDGTVNYLKQVGSENPKIKVIFNQNNFGFAVGHNQGIEESQGEFILCLNQDVVLDKDFIKRAIEVLEKDGKTAAVQGKILRMPLTSKIIDVTGLVILKNRRVIARGQGQTDRGQFEKIEEIFGADGAVPVYRRKALDDIRLAKVKPLQNYKGLTLANFEYFDEDFFVYKEDVDLAWRMQLYGWQTIYQPMAIAWHWRGSGDSAVRTPWGIIKERRKINQFSKYLSFKNQRLMQLKNDQGWLLLKHLPCFLSKEIASWFYVLLFERYTWRAIKDLFKQMSRAWQKRKMIMVKKRVSLKEIGRWFK